MLERRIESALVCVLLALGIYLRFLDLSWIPAINADETWYPQALEKLLSSFHYPQTPMSTRPSPLFLLLQLPALWLPRLPFLLRLPALVCGLATIWIAGRVANEMSGGYARRVILVLVACSPVAIVYSKINYDAALSRIYSP